LIQFQLETHSRLTTGKKLVSHTMKYRIEEISRFLVDNVQAVTNRFRLNNGQTGK